MRILEATDYTGKTTFVALSERNLQTLVNKLNDPSSAKTIYRHVSDRHTIVVMVESNDVHYKDREPGPVHPDHDPLVAR